MPAPESPGTDSVMATPRTAFSRKFRTRSSQKKQNPVYRECISPRGQLASPSVTNAFSPQTQVPSYSDNRHPSVNEAVSGGGAVIAPTNQRLLSWVVPAQTRSSSASSAPLVVRPAFGHFPGSTALKGAVSPGWCGSVVFLLWQPALTSTPSFTALTCRF